METKIVITPQTWLLISLMVQNALSAAFNTVAKMTPEEIAAGTAIEEEKKKANMAETDSH